MWAVMFYIEDSEMVYDTGKTAFTADDPPLVFHNKEAAQARAATWNTGVVVPYIREMTDDERQRSREREAANYVHRRI
tara:strand:- start:228 stop:461 length:234 start_codon:yes stop_codon:yes gene_type:complete